MDIRKSWLVSLPIAHRGLHNADFPENSIGAFENAAQNNFAIELDVRLSDDENVIVFHDDSLTRMTSADGYVCNFSLAELKELKLSNTEYSIPTLEEVLKLVSGRVPILIEIKNSNKVGVLEAKTAKLLASYKGDVAVQSFNPYSMEYFKNNAPQILRGQLSTYFTKDELSFFKRYMLKRLKMNFVSKPDFISYNFVNLPNRYVTRAKLPVLAWTVRSNAEMEQVLPYCDNIIFEKFIPEITKEE